MYWKDEGYLLSKTNFDENSIFIEAFTLNHGKCGGVVYGGSSKKLKKNFQIGNKILLNWKSKGENKVGYFNTELIKPISPLFFDDKKRSICVLAATSILKILLPERQINKKIYHSFDQLVEQFNHDDWIQLYIFWELSLIKELGFGINFIDKNYPENHISNTIEINDRYFKIPKLLLEQNSKNFSNAVIKEALTFNKSLLMENFILPHRLRLPLSRSILEKYFN
jgi:DNA repair protein RecO (recombination protein O)